MNFSKNLSYCVMDELDVLAFDRWKTTLACIAIGWEWIEYYLSQIILSSGGRESMPRVCPPNAARDGTTGGRAHPRGPIVRGGPRRGAMPRGLIPSFSKLALNLPPIPVNLPLSSIKCPFSLIIIYKTSDLVFRPNTVPLLSYKLIRNNSFMVIWFGYKLLWLPHYKLTNISNNHN